MEGNPSDYTIKEILTDFIIPRLDKLGDWQEKHEKEDRKAFAELFAYKNRLIGALALISAVVSALAVVVATQL